MSEVLLETVDLVKHFPLTQALADTFARREKDVIHAVDGVSLQLGASETLGLIGESGSGKTTLGWLAARLHEPTSGTLRFRRLWIEPSFGRASRRCCLVWAFCRPYWINILMNSREAAVSASPSRGP